MSEVLFKLLQWTYWPVCRFYAKHFVGDRPADDFLRYLCSFQFWLVHRYMPNFSNPVSFNEKLWSRMLHERDPIYTLISDKLRVREYVSNKVGNDFLVPLIWHGEKTENIPLDDLPLKFVMKTNHGCGYIIIITDKSQLDWTNIKKLLNKWLSVNFGQDTFLGIAWGYKNIKPQVIIEPFLEENGKAPVDYKFYCFSGCVEFLTLHYDRFEEHKTRAFDRNFKPYDFRYNFGEWKGECQRPSNFDAMVELAESLSAGFDFMRVDLYNVEKKIYFSELTPYPGGVNTKFLPLERDYILGEKWRRREEK